MDALTVLRQSIKDEQPVTYSIDDVPSEALNTATHIVFGSSKFPKSQRTRYRKSGGATPDDVYSLDALYLAWKFRNAPSAEYMKQMRESGLAVGFVSVTERKDVVEWLEGKSTDGARLVPQEGVFFIQTVSHSNLSKFQAQLHLQGHHRKDYALYQLQSHLRAACHRLGPLRQHHPSASMFLTRRTSRS